MNTIINELIQKNTLLHEALVSLVDHIDNVDSFVPRGMLHFYKPLCTFRDITGTVNQENIDKDIYVNDDSYDIKHVISWVMDESEASVDTIMDMSTLVYKIEEIRKDLRKTLNDEHTNRSNVLSKSEMGI